MTAIFDGMAGALADVFGAPVLYTPKTGEPQTVQATLRLEPTEVQMGDGHTQLISAPTLRVPRTTLPGIARGDRISLVSEPAAEYLVVNRIPSGSPAVDADILCELEPVIASGGV